MPKHNEKTSLDTSHLTQEEFANLKNNLVSATAEYQPPTQFLPAQPKPTKHWWQSRTIWVNTAVAFGGAVVGGVKYVVDVAPDIAPLVQPMVDAGTFGTVMTVVGLCNILLRRKTGKAIKGTRLDVQPLPPVSDFDANTKRQGAGRND